MTKINDGGQLESISRDLQLRSVNIKCEGSCIQLWLNENSLSYLTIEEAIGLRNELNDALRELIGV